jgi:hypothetical protein
VSDRVIYKCVLQVRRNEHSAGWVEAGKAMLAAVLRDHALDDRIRNGRTYSFHPRLFALTEEPIRARRRCAIMRGEGQVAKKRA